MRGVPPALVLAQCVLALGCSMGSRPVAPGSTPRRRMPHGYRVSTSVETARATDHAIVRGLLDETGCIQALERGSPAPVRLVVKADAGPRSHPGRLAVAAVEWLTLTPLIGLPIPSGVDGTATARLFVDGRETRSYDAHRQDAYWTSIYTRRASAERASTRLRTELFEDVVEQVVPDLCGGPLEE
jgi:hypothetical protein